MAALSRRERADLAALLESVGPDAPTLCGDWTTYDLAAHIVLRERNPVAAPGILVPALEGLANRGMDKLKAKHDYADLVDKVRAGPHRLSPWSVSHIDKLVNTVEFFVHHEDVRRAQPGWTVRELDARDEKTLWAAVQRMARMLVRRSTVGLELVNERTGSSVRGKGGSSSLVVTGAPSELILFAYGRCAVAEVTLDGDSEVQERFDPARLGL